MPAIGVVANTSLSNVAPLWAALWQGLNETGYVEGKNAVGEYRFAEGHYDRVPGLTAELVNRKVDVLIASRPAPSGPQRRRARPRRSRSSSSVPTTRSGAVLLPVWPDPAAT